MKIKKLNARGFSHDVIAVLFVGLFVIVGVGFMVGSHADASNPNNCGGIKPGSVNQTVGPAGPNKLTPIYEYANQNIGVLGSGATTAILKGSTQQTDFFYSTSRNDVWLASLGYCYVTTQGYAYTNQVPGTEPVHQYWSPTLYKHFYTTASANVEPYSSCTFCNYQDQGVMAYISASRTPGTVPLYRYFLQNSAGPIATHYYVATDSPGVPNLPSIFTFKGYINEGIWGFVWSSPVLPNTGGAAPSSTPTQKTAAAEAKAKSDAAAATAKAEEKAADGQAGNKTATDKQTGSTTGSEAAKKIMEDKQTKTIAGKVKPPGTVKKLLCRYTPAKWIARSSCSVVTVSDKLNKAAKSDQTHTNQAKSKGKG